MLEATGVGGDATFDLAAPIFTLLLPLLSPLRRSHSAGFPSKENRALEDPRRGCVVFRPRPFSPFSCSATLRGAVASDESALSTRMPQETVVAATGEAIKSRVLFQLSETVVVMDFTIGSSSVERSPLK